MSERPLVRKTTTFGAATLAVAMLATALAASTARAEDTIEKRLWLKTGGGVVTLDRFRELREDCALVPAPTVVVAEEPAFGKLTVAKIKAVGKTDPNGPYAACDGKPSNWTVVKIPSPAKGEGTARTVIRAQESSGEVTTYEIEIVYAKKLPQGKTPGLLEDR